MLESYFSYRGVLKRLRSGALGNEMDRIAEHFLSLGYKRASAKIYLSRISRFSRFAAMRCGSMPIGQDVIDSYLRRFSTDSPRIAAVSALGHARRLAPERFIASVPSTVGDLEKLPAHAACHGNFVNVTESNRERTRINQGRFHGG
jgi:integrase/recombinase XerD